MAQNLVTIATFDQAAKARLAQNVLTEAGIRAAVTDETVVAMDWLLGNAVGWIKLQVMDGDAEQAVRVLNESFGEDGEGFGQVDPAQLIEEAETSKTVEDEPREADFAKCSAPMAATSIEPNDSPSEREDNARRVVFIAWIGIVFPPVAFYAVYMFLTTAFGEGELSGRGRFHLCIGGAMSLAAIAWAYIFVQLIVVR